MASLPEDMVLWVFLHFQGLPDLRNSSRPVPGRDIPLLSTGALSGRRCSSPELLEEFRGHHT